MGSTTQMDLGDRLDRDGFVIVPSELTADELQELRDACQQVTTLAREGKWPRIRTLPKQFPPWGSTPGEKGIWGVQHLLHPDLPHHTLFAKSYFSNKNVSSVCEILHCTPEDLSMELYNLLVRPDNDFELRWHRDDIARTATSEEEMARLGQPSWHAQWNFALYEDSSLVVVAGTHKRARTEEERNADPYEGDLPNQLVVKMNPGDMVFYNNNILHRGVYSSKTERMTLHGSFGHVKGGSVRARNVLQHGIGDWVKTCNFDEIDDMEARERAEIMRDKLFDLGRSAGDVGYSQED